jgi:two-component system, OmpR family, phosphate regulon sensor histidine kinase PhoR
MSTLISPSPTSPSVIPMSSPFLKPLWLEALPFSQGCEVSPRGFNQGVKSVIDFLRSQKIQATLWVKLPQGKAWWTDLQAYSQDFSAPIYRLGYPDMLTEELHIESPQAQDSSHCCLIPLSPQYALKGEYLFLVLAKDFIYTMVALRHSDANTLTLLISTSPKPVQHLKQGLRDLGVAAAALHPADTTLTKLLSQWEQAWAGIDNQTPATTTRYDDFLTWQYQNQTHLQKRLNQFHQYTNPSTPINAPIVTTSEPLKALSDLEEFAQAAIQELRFPLTTIKTALTLINSSSLKHPQRQRYLSMIAQASDHQSALINGIFELLQYKTRTTQPASYPIDLMEWLPGVVSTYQPLAQERHIMLAYTINDNLPHVVTIEPWLKQALIQILNNAIKFTSNQGQVWVHAKPATPETVIISIEDTGIGLSEPELKKVFEAFYRSPNPPGKTPSAGLGLTLAKQLLEQSGSSIHAEGKLGKGAIFTITLPIDQASRI